MYFFISGAEIALIFFIILLIFGADKIPSIARTMAKSITQIRQATNEIKSEIQKSTDINESSDSITKELKKEYKNAKEDFDELKDSLKRKL